jgi:hypothetical protein
MKNVDKLLAGFVEEEKSYSFTSEDYQSNSLHQVYLFLSKYV